MNTKVIDVKFIGKKELGLILQVISIIGLIILGIMYMLGKDVSVPIYLVMSLTMFIMAFNNHYTFKKKNMTIIYIIVGLIVLISTIFEVIM